MSTESSRAEIVFLETDQYGIYGTCNIHECTIEMINKSLSEKFSSGEITVKSKKDAIDFLKRDDPNKPNLDRYISWLVKFDVLPENFELWGESLFYHFKEYRDNVNFIKEKIANGALSDRIIMRIIPNIYNDVKRSYSLFPFFYKGNSFCSPDNIINRVTRLICLTILNMPYHEYDQGFDRLGYVCFSMGLISMISLEIGDFCMLEGEALGWLILRQIIFISESNTLTFCSGEVSSVYFAELDSFIRKNNSTFYNRVVCKGEFDSVARLLAPEWICTFFVSATRGYKGQCEEFLLIWDFLVLNSDDLDLSVKILVSSFIKQIELPEGEIRSLNSALNQKWNFSEIVREADYMKNSLFQLKSYLSMPLSFWL